MKKEENKVAVFHGKTIRKIMHEGEWWFSIIDVVEALTDSDRPRKYWNDLKKKLKTEGYFELSEKIGQLKILSSDGKLYKTDCANTETMFRIIQSIPSKKVEPQDRNSMGFEPLKKDAASGGAVAGRTRKDIERRTGKKVVSKENYLPLKNKQVDLK